MANYELDVERRYGPQWRDDIRRDAGLKTVCEFPNCKCDCENNGRHVCCKDKQWRSPE